MSKNRFVVPSTVKAELSEGDWIELKEWLTYGEQQRLASSALSRMTNAGADAGIDLDFEKHSLMRMETWVVDWSFVGPNGKPVEITRRAISALQAWIASDHVAFIGWLMPLAFWHSCASLTVLTSQATDCVSRFCVKLISFSRVGPIPTVKSLDHGN
jgi:hypothetical protein